LKIGLYKITGGICLFVVVFCSSMRQYIVKFVGFYKFVNSQLLKVSRKINILYIYISFIQLHLVIV